MHAYAYAEQIVNHPDATIDAIWDDDVSRGELAAKTYGTTYYGDLDHLLAADIDVVIICSENAHHKSHVIRAAHYKKPMLCEKLIATNIDDVISMIKKCHENGVQLQIAYPVRFIAAIRQANDINAAVNLGEIFALKASNHRMMPGGWYVERNLSGGRSATDHIVHIMDVLRWKFDDEPERFYAEYDTHFQPIDVEDCGSVQVE